MMKMPLSYISNIPAISHAHALLSLKKYHNQWWKIWVEFENYLIYAKNYDICSESKKTYAK